MESSSFTINFSNKMDIRDTQKIHVTSSITTATIEIKETLFRNGKNINENIIKKISVSESEFQEKLQNYMESIYQPTIKRAFETLLNKIDFLGLQLNFEYGNLDEDYFNQEAKNYIIKKNNDYEIETLCKEIEALEKISGIKFDLDVLSDIFKCKVQQINKAILTQNNVSCVVK